MADLSHITPLGPVERLRAADPGYELCYECRGKRVCWSCEGNGRFDDEICNECHAFRWCIVCRGGGQLSEGTAKGRG